ncbi:hypothetical protein GF386_01015 [Candidatus Pacearchaeota archaeon]|nr:hypothetical protein [Candidatus Pacearchaeota archaeon]MBD3282816.1 hypothetical protein [Candidatus Pacearchaeota archaeon]
MKLQKILSRRYKGKNYHKYIIVIPEDEINKAKFKQGDELKIESKKGEVRIRKV